MKYIYYLVFASVVLSLNAQQKVIGTVLDSTSSKPLRDVNVIISNSTIGTITNDNGSFSLFIPDEYHKEAINFSSIGYGSKKLILRPLMIVC